MADIDEFSRNEYHENNLTDQSKYSIAAIRL